MKYLSGEAQTYDGHARARDGGELDGSGETLVTLGVVVLEADLELDRLQKVALLGLIAVLEEFLDVRTNARDLRTLVRYRSGPRKIIAGSHGRYAHRNFRHGDDVSQGMLTFSFGSSAAVWLLGKSTWIARTFHGGIRFAYQYRASHVSNISWHWRLLDARAALQRPGTFATDSRQRC